MVGGGSSIVGRLTAPGEAWTEEEANSSSEELMVTAAARAGADLRRVVSVEAFGLEAGRGGLNAGALRFGAGFAAAGMTIIRGRD